MRKWRAEIKKYAILEGEARQARNSKAANYYAQKGREAYRKYVKALNRPTQTQRGGGSNLGGVLFGRW